MWGRKEEPSTTPTSSAPSSSTSSSPTPRPAPQVRPPDEPVQRPAAAAPAPPPAARPTAPRPASSSPGSGAHLGKSVKVKGQITGSEDLLVDGEVDGKITLEGNNLTIGPNGNVRAEVIAHSITVLGRLEGNVRAADRVEIRKTGSLEGDLVTARIAIEEDAVFRGSIDIVKPGAQTSDEAPGGKAKAAAKSGSN